MPSWNDLPTEILVIIFSEFDRRQRFNKDLQQCALTCRQWRRLARPLLFSTIEINSFNQLMQLMDIYWYKPSCKKLIKCIKVFMPKEMDLIFDIVFDYASTLFPKLEKFIFEKTDMNYLLFCKLVCNDKFLTLKYLPGPKNQFQEKYYLDCLEKRKYLDSTVTLTDNITFQHMYNKLDQFVNLKEIYIGLYKQVGTFICFLESIHRENKMPSVKKMNIRLNTEGGVPSAAVSLVDIQPLYGVTDLTITSPKDINIINQFSMLYIIKKFPNLTDLSIFVDQEEVECDSFYRFTTSIFLSIDVTLQFMHYLSKINVFIVEPVITQEKTVPVIERFYSSIYNNNDSIKHQELTLNFDFEGKEGHIYKQPTLTIYKKYERGGIIINFDQQRESERWELESLKYVGQYFSDLILIHPPNFQYGAIMEYSAKYCTRLKKVIIGYGPCLQENFEYKQWTQNQTVEDITLSCCELYSASSSFFPSISHLFPNLKTLVIEQCDKERSGERSFIKMDMPNNSLIRLDLQIGFGASSTEDSHYTIINGVCIRVLTEKETHHLFFAFENGGIRKYHRNLLEFSKHLTASEFESMADDEQYDVYDVSCKSIEVFTLRPIKKTLSPIPSIFSFKR